MAYEDITYELLLNRMLDRVSNSLDKREGSLLYNANAPAAAELQELYIQLDAILNETFVDTCSREYLLKRMSERGLYPNPATNAVLKCVITPSTISDDSVIGKRFNINDLNYTCTKSLGNGEYELVCETAGDVGNHPIGNLTVIENEIEGMTTAVIPSNAIISRGYDEEDTESCRQKYYDSLNTTTFGGNIADYKNKVKSSDTEVGAVKVFPNTNENGESGKGGHVRILILNSNLNIADSELISTIQEKIDPTEDGSGLGIAPIGHIVHIDTTTTEDIYVNITGTLTNNVSSFSDIEDAVRQKINEYIYKIKQDWEDKESLSLNAQALYGDIASIDGFAELTVKFTDVSGNTKYDSISITNHSIPTLGDVTFTVRG